MNWFCQDIYISISCILLNILNWLCKLAIIFTKISICSIKRRRLCPWSKLNKAKKKLKMERPDQLLRHSMNLGWNQRRRIIIPLFSSLRISREPPSWSMKRYSSLMEQATWKSNRKNARFKSRESKIHPNFRSQTQISKCPTISLSTQQKTGIISFWNRFSIKESLSKTCQQQSVTSQWSKARI